MIIKKTINFLKGGNHLNRLYMKFGKPTILHNKVLIDKDNQDKCSKYFKKKYGYVIDSFHYDSSKCQKQVKKIWAFWY